MLSSAVICVLECKLIELGAGWGSYAIVLLVSPLVSLTIAKFIALSERWFVVDGSFHVKSTQKFLPPPI